MAKLEQDVKGLELDNKLLKEFCIILDEELTDYKRLTSNHETRKNMLIQDKMKLQKDSEAAETKVRGVHIVQNEERTQRLVAECNMEQLISEISDIESERNSIMSERDQYEKLAQERQELSAQVKELTARCSEMECDLAKMSRALQVAKEESRVVKEESSKNLTRVHELKEANSKLRANAEQSMRKSIDQGQELRSRIAELENVLEETKQFYQEREVKAESTRQQQTNLIDYLQLQWEECIKKKILGEILGTKQKENMPSVSLGMPVEYREIENKFIKERAKVKALTGQILIGSASAPKSSTTPECEGKKAKSVTETSSLLRQINRQRIMLNIPDRLKGLPPF